jgi:hypothetical protein
VYKCPLSSSTDVLSKVLLLMSPTSTSSMDGQPHTPCNQAVLTFLLLTCTVYIWYSSVDLRRRRLAEIDRLRRRLARLRRTAQQSQEHLRQGRTVMEERTRVFRGHENGRLEYGENAASAPTTAEMNEFLRQGTRLRDQIEEWVERVSAAMRMREPPPRYSQVLRDAESIQRPALPVSCTSQIPLPTQQPSALQTISSTLSTQQNGDYEQEHENERVPRREDPRRPVSQPAPVPISPTNGSFHFSRSLPNPLPREALMLTESEVLAVTTQLYQIFFDSHPDMPIQQARYYARSLRNAMLPHIPVTPTPRRPVTELARGTSSRNEPMRRTNDVSAAPATTGSTARQHTNGEFHVTESAPLHMFDNISINPVESPAPSRSLRRVPPTIQSDFPQRFANSINDTTSPLLRPPHINGDETPGDESSPSDSSDATLVNSQSDDELPAIHLILLLPSDDESDEETPVVEIHTSNELDSEGDIFTNGLH